MTKKSLMIASAIILPLTVGVMAMGIGASNMNNNGYSPIKATTLNEYSLTFTGEDEYSADETTYTYEKTTTNGNKVYLVSTGGMTKNSNTIAKIPSTYETNYESPVLKFYKYSDASKAFRHQEIDSITIKTSGTVTISVLTSSDGLVYREKGTVSCSSSGGTFSDFNQYDRFVGITVSSKPASSRSINEVSITYGCENVTETPFVSGHYRTVVKDNSDKDSEINIYINSDNYGYLTFYNNTISDNLYTLFTWVFDEELNTVIVSYTSNATGSIAGKTASGTASQYQGYCLFDRFSSSDIRSTRLAIFDGEVRLFFNTTASSGTKPETARRATATIMTIVA